MTQEYRDDDLAPVRGFYNGTRISIALWAVIAVAIFACSGAMAQNTTSNAGAESTSGATAGAGAFSGSTAIVNITRGGGGGGGGAVNAQQAGEIARAQGYNGRAGLTRNEQGVEYSGGTNNVQRNIIQGGTNDTYRATIRNTPDAYAPNVSGGTNSCLVGMSGAGSVAGFGFGLGGNWSDPDCERRQLAALAHNTGNAALAQEVMCGSQTVRDARIRMNQPCLVDLQIAQERERQRAAQVGAGAVPPAQVAPVATGAVLVPAAATQAPVGRADWCSGVGMADRPDTRQTCGWTGRNFSVRPR